LNFEIKTIFSEEVSENFIQKKCKRSFSCIVLQEETLPPVHLKRPSEDHGHFFQFLARTLVGHAIGVFVLLLLEIPIAVIAHSTEYEERASNESSMLHALSSSPSPLTHSRRRCFHSMAR
jgi:hypothetical protein